MVIEVAFAVIAAISSRDDFFFPAGKIEVIDSDIKSVSLRDSRNALPIPITTLDSPTGLTLNFDIIGAEHETLKTRLRHCNADWKDSDLVTSEWTTSINEFLLEDFAYSSSTHCQFVNYSFPIIPRELGLISSGNYVLEVFREDFPEEYILAVPFSVAETTGNLSASVFSNTDAGFNSMWQQLEIKATLPDDLTLNPISDIIVTVTQNRDPSSERRLQSPLVANRNQLSFAHSPQLIFEAGNEFRRFETVRTDYPGMHVDSTNFINGMWRARLADDFQRADSPYSFDQTQRGRFVIDEYNSSDPDLGADYVMVEFSLDFSEDVDGDIYVDGDFTYHELSESNRMRRDRESGKYTLAIPLKQGSYNYRYLVSKDGEERSASSIEGNFHETSNEYLVKMFLRFPGSRGDRLISYISVISNGKDL